MTTRKFLALFLALLLCLSMVACSKTNDGPVESEARQDTQDSQEETSSEPIKVGVALPQMKVEWFAQFGENLEKMAPDYNVEITVVSADGDTATQSDQVDNFVTMGMDYIVCCGVGGTGCLDAMIRAVEAGVPVLNIMNDISDYPEAYTYTVLQDEYTIGYSIAQFASEWIDQHYPDAEDGSIQVALAGMSHTPDAILRTNGMKAIEELNSKVTIVQEFTYNLGEDPNAKTAEYGDILFTAYPDTKVFLAFNADIATGMNTVAGRYNKSYDDFAVYGCDWTIEFANALRAAVNNESYIRGNAACWTNLELTVFNFILENEEYISEVDENRVYWNPIYTVLPDKVDDFIKMTTIG